MALYSAAKSQGIPEPMNASSHHPKVKLSLALSDPVFVAGTYISGKMKMECRADKGLGIGVIMVDLFAIQELSSRDHTATSTFLHSRRLFQGPGLPPSNAVYTHPLPGDPPLPQPYYPARRGHSTFLFRIPLPGTCPSSINFAQGQAKVRYELRASAGVYWREERRSVLSRMIVDVVDRYPIEEVIASGGKEPEGVIVGENGKLWVQGKVLGSVVVAGSTACLELQVKNHSIKKNTSLTLSLTRTLFLPSSSASTTQFPHPVQLSETLTTVPFRGPEYIIPPGAEGVANLVFDVPKHARGVRGGVLDGEELEEGGRPRISESLFEIRCKVEVKLGMGMGSKDIRLEVPIDVVHPQALPPPNEIIGSYAASTSPAPADPYYNPIIMPYIDAAHNQVWLPPPAVYPPPFASPYHPQQFYGTQSPPPHLPMSPVHQPIATLTTGLGLTSGMPYPHTLSPVSLNSLPMQAQPYLQLAAMPPRPLSAGPVASASQLPQSMVPGLPAPEVSPVRLLPLPEHAGGLLDNTSPAQGLQSPSRRQASPSSGRGYMPEEGKGERALRVSRHLKISSRHRSVSPLSHRYPLPQSMLQDEGEGEHAREDVDMLGLGRMLPVPPMANTIGTTMGELTPSLSTSPLATAQHLRQATVVHSPRPQLTPKHSFTRDNAPAKSERVEELEKIADVVVTRSGNDLSGDVPKEVVEKVEEEVRERAREQEKEQEQEDKVIVVAVGKDASLKKNKTLPEPPSEVEVGLAFFQESDPFSLDQTPPTPTIHALSVRGRDRDKEKEMERGREREKHKELLQELRTESGLDALERRLLKEVGTRKLNAPPRPDVRSLLGMTSSPLPPLEPGDMVFDTAAGASAVAEDTSSNEGQGRNGGAIPIPIPVMSPEPLNDSAISSLTLAGALGDDDDSDGGRTHKAGSRSRGGSLDGGAMDTGRLGWMNGNEFHRHMRERAEIITRTPTKTPEKEKEKERPSKESKASHHRKKGKSTAAKGRVAAWLGRIDVGVPPQEQVIPPSPSVVRAPDQVPDLDLEGAGSGDDGKVLLVQDVGKVQQTKMDTVNAEPNPRSSGFVPIATLNRNTIQLPDMSGPLILRDGTIVEEARTAQALWSASSSSSAAPALAETPTFAQTQNPQDQQTVHKFPMIIPRLARAQSIKTDRRVSPPSTKLVSLLPALKENDNQMTDRGALRDGAGPVMSYSAAAKNAWKQVDRMAVLGPPGATYTPPLASTATSKPLPSGRSPAFPLKPLVDPEVKYDIRSARGGRGGKVMTVANLWASGAIMNQANSNLNSITTDGRTRTGMSEVGKVTGRREQDKVVQEDERRIDGERRKTVQEDERKLLKPTPPSKDTKFLSKTGKKLFSAALKAPAPPARSVVPTAATNPVAEGKSGPPLTATRPVISFPNSSPGPGPSKPRLEPQKRLDSRKVLQTPNMRSSNQDRPATAMSNPGPERRGRPHISGGKSIPMFTLSTPSPDSRSPDLVTIGGGSKPKPAIIISPSTNPATVELSSSHAIPHLSSTASLARPHTSSSATPSATVAPRLGNPNLPALISASTSAPSLVPSIQGRNSNPTPTLPNKPADLSFGQARLKDLIKKYQG